MRSESPGGAARPRQAPAARDSVLCAPRAPAGCQALCPPGVERPSWQGPGKRVALSPQGLGTRTSPVTAPGGVSPVGPAPRVRTRACPARRHRRKFPSCLCMSLSFTRGCSLSLLGAFQLLCRLRVRARACLHSPGPRAPASAGRALGSPTPERERRRPCSTPACVVGSGGSPRRRQEKRPFCPPCLYNGLTGGYLRVHGDEEHRAQDWALRHGGGHFQEMCGLMGSATRSPPEASVPSVGGPEVL